MSTSEPPSQPSPGPQKAEPRPPAPKPPGVSKTPQNPRSVSEKPARPIPWRKILLGLLAALVVSVGVGAAVLYSVVRSYTVDLPDVTTLEHGYAPPQVTRILARDRTLLENVYTERRTVVPLEKIPDHVKLAFLAAEDAHFYEHQGLNPLGLLRAILVNLRSGTVRQGGSTITQQVVKNVLLDSERSYRRKVRETILAYRIEKHLSKEQILGMYLNHIYLGHGRYGVQEASRYLFGKDISQLSVAEGALLAGIVASPERYSPRKNMEKALLRRKYVLGQMQAKAFVSAEVYEAAMKEVVLMPPNTESESEIAPEVVRLARRSLEKIVGEKARQGGYTVVTTIDPALQVLARQSLRDGLDAYPKRQKLAPPYTLKSRKLWGKPLEGKARRYRIYNGTVLSLNDEAKTFDVQVGETIGRVYLAREDRYNPTRLLPSQFVEKGAQMRVRVVDDPALASAEQPVTLALELGPQAALVAIDVETGEVVALVGNYEALPGALDRATQSKRQPGSTFKPLVYGYGLSSGKITAATPYRFPLSEAKLQELERARAKQLEEEPDAVLPPLEREEVIALRKGVATSDNRVAQATLKRVGAENVVAFAHSMGIESKLGADLSLALGAYEVTPLEMASVYSVFARGGEKIAPSFIKMVESGSGLVPLPEAEAPEAVLTPQAAYMMTSILESVIEEGTGKRARSLGRPLAGKTGTTNRARDAWFVGYSTQYAVAVWVGYDDTLPLGWGEAGAVAALPIWIDFMKGAHEGKPKTSFPVPSEIVTRKIDPDTGLLARYGQTNAYSEIFIQEFAPTEAAPEPVSPVAAPEQANEGSESADDATAEGAEDGSEVEPQTDDEASIAQQQEEEVDTSNIAPPPPPAEGP